MQGALQHLVDASANTLVFRPYLYFAIAALLLPLAWRQRDAFALLASGLIYELTLLPFAPSAEYRYSHWMIVCTVLAVVILVRERAPRAVT